MIIENKPSYFERAEHQYSRLNGKSTELLTRLSIAESLERIANALEKQNERNRPY